jgi:hypothetical protein
LRLGIGAAAARDETNPEISCQLDMTGHAFHPGYLSQSALAGFDNNIIAKRARIALA